MRTRTLPVASSPESRSSRGNPKRVGAGFVEYPLSWAYAFESDVPLVGAPNFPPL